MLRSVPSPCKQATCFLGHRFLFHLLKATRGHHTQGHTKHPQDVCSVDILLVMKVITDAKLTAALHGSQVLRSPGRFSICHSCVCDPATISKPTLQTAHFKCVFCGTHFLLLPPAPLPLCCCPLAPPVQRGQVQSSQVRQAVQVQLPFTGAPSDLWGFCGAFVLLFVWLLLIFLLWGKVLRQGLAV
jgi:hypothetical protein